MLNLSISSLPDVSVSFCRVRLMISHRAGLKMVPWDGYLKHSRPSSPRLTESKYVYFSSSISYTFLGLASLMFTSKALMSILLLSILSSSLIRRAIDAQLTSTMG